MDASQVYIIMSVVILGSCSCLELFVAPKKPWPGLSVLTALAFGSARGLIDSLS
jgi:hypothetical protein